MINDIAYFMLLAAVVLMVIAYRKQSRKLDEAEIELNQAKAEIELLKIHLNRVYSDLNDALGEE